MQGWGGMIGSAIESMALAMVAAFVVITLLASTLCFVVSWFFWGIAAAWLSVAACLFLALLFVVWVET